MKAECWLREDEGVRFPQFYSRSLEPNNGLVQQLSKLVPWTSSIAIEYSTPDLPRGKLGGEAQ